MKRIGSYLLFAILPIVLASMSVAAQEPAATATLTPTGTPVPTDTPTPTTTASSESESQVPTATETPTATPEPTETSTETPSTATPTVTSTATVTPLWPTDTPSPTVTWTPSPTCADLFEPNNQPGHGPALMIGQTLAQLTLYPIGDGDFFGLWAKGGRYYQLTTTTSDGIDTRIRVFDPLGNLVAENDDYQPGNPASRVTFIAPGEGWFAVAVDSRAPIEWGCRRYSVSVVDVSPPTATPTRTPGPPPTSTRIPTPTATPTSIPGEVMYDEYEPNYDFEHAANLGVNQTIELNFNPFPAGTHAVDVDFFRFYVKVEDRLQIETTNLAEGLDTNLIVYRDNGELVMGNDDCRAGERYSCLEWTPEYTGLAYLMVGPVGTIPEAISGGARTYQLTVKNIAGGSPTDAVYPGGGTLGSTPTPAFGQNLPWAVTPLPPTPVSPTGAITTSTAPTLVEPTAPLSIRPFSLAPPTATPKPRQTIAIELTVYYDENNNRAPDTGEGIIGLSVRALDGIKNDMVGQTFTDDNGHATLAVSAPGEIRVSIPFLGYTQPVRPPGKNLVVRLEPQRLPSLIP